MAFFYHKHRSTAIETGYRFCYRDRRLPIGNCVKTFGLYVKRGAPEAGRAAEEAIDWLKGRGCTALFDAEVTEEYGIEGGMPMGEVLDRCDVLVVLGGDGTFLAASRVAARLDIPIVGVNLGGLGFLTETPVSEMIETFSLVLDGKAEFENRALFDVVVHSGGKSECHEVLNDVVIGKSALARIIQVRASIGGEMVTELLADGLIVATPTGSTAYSMAAGGPIVHPSVDAFVLTPICPHLLANLPLLVPTASELTLDLVSDGHCYVTLDGQVGMEFRQGDSVVMKKADRSLMVLRNPNRSYFQTLRDKLRWGQR
jgi:NAD+ kinase